MNMTHTSLTMTRKRRSIAMRMAVMRAAMHPIIIERIPAPINKTSPSPNPIHIAQADIAIRNDVINDTRIIFGNIHIFFADRLNRDVFVHRHRNLVITIQIAILVGYPAHSLHGIHHIGLLHFNRFAELMRPCRIFCQLAKYIRERN